MIIIRFATVAVMVLTIGGSFFVYMTIQWLRWIVQQVKDVRPARR